MKNVRLWLYSQLYIPLRKSLEDQVPAGGAFPEQWWLRMVNGHRALSAEGTDTPRLTSARCHPCA